MDASETGTLSIVSTLATEPHQTDCSEPSWVKANAFDFHWALQYCHPADLAAMRSIAKATGKIAIFGELIGKPVRHRGRKAAVLRLIHDGELQPVFSRERITARSPLLVKIADDVSERRTVLMKHDSKRNQERAYA